MRGQQREASLTTAIACARLREVTATHWRKAKRCSKQSSTPLSIRQAAYIREVKGGGRGSTMYGRSRYPNKATYQLLLPGGFPLDAGHQAVESRP